MQGLSISSASIQRLQLHEEGRISLRFRIALRWKRKGERMCLRYQQGRELDNKI